MSLATGTEQRWTLVRLAAREGSFTHQRGKQELDLASGALSNHLDLLLGGCILKKHSGAYWLTDWGTFAYELLEYGASGTPGWQLVGKRLVAAKRPDGVKPNQLIDLLRPGARGILRTDGEYKYIAIYDDAPDLVEDLLHSLHSVGAKSASVRVSHVD